MLLIVLPVIIKIKILEHAYLVIQPVINVEINQLFALVVLQVVILNTFMSQIMNV